jgi:N-acetylneuraminic acid mutarotase
MLVIGNIKSVLIGKTLKTRIDSGSAKRSMLSRAIFRKLCIFFVIVLLVPGCKKDESTEDSELTGDWVKLSDFEGVSRSDAVVFTIGKNAYVGTGYDGTDRLNDFWEYDVSANQWTRKADFPGSARIGAVSFGTDTKGYIGTGYDGVNKLKDFWEYDPSTNVWTQKADFGGSARYGAVAFAIENKGYIGTGYDGNLLKDFWQYNPASDTWTQIYSLGGSKRRDAIAFVINGKGYVCTGIDNGSYISDFWVYDPSANQWTRKRDIANTSDDDYDNKYSSITGINKCAFTISGKGYVTVGGSGTAENYVWEYDPTSDLWTQKTSFEGTGRVEAVGFAIDNMGFVTTGRSSSLYFDDLWGFETDH